MASVLKDGGGWRIRFYDSNGARKQIRLAGINKATAEQIGRHVKVLNAAKISNDRSLDRQTALWLADVGQTIHDKLAAAGLVEQRVSSNLGDFIAGYIERRSDVEPGTVTNYHQVRLNLVAFFGYEKPLRDITERDAAEFRTWLETAEGQSENTLRRRCGRARQFFTAAIKAKLIEENPFDGMPVSVGGSKDKTRFITEAESQKILKACPDLQWRLIFSLCRYGGVRCPSEILALTWENILWDSQRIIVTAPKTKRYAGHETRVIPMFPELAGVLNEAYEMAFDRLEDKSAVVSGPVVTRYSSASQNLRTTFDKIIKRAGLVPWPKPFQNLRATRETELMESYPSHVVVAWIGHSETVARKHYLQVTDANFARATSKVLAPQAAPQLCGVIETEENTEIDENEKTVVFTAFSAEFASLPEEQITRPGLERTTGNAGQRALSEMPGPTGGPIGPDLQTIIDAWPDLPQTTRAKILRDVQRALR
jgi:integrase